MIRVSWVAILIVLLHLSTCNLDRKRPGHERLSSPLANHPTAERVNEYVFSEFNHSI